MKKFLKNRIKNIIKHPGMWGDKFSVETQIFLLIECWKVQHNENHDNVVKDWCKYLYDNGAPGPNNLPLAHRKDIDDEEFRKFISGFVKEQTGITV